MSIKVGEKGRNQNQESNEILKRIKGIVTFFGVLPVLDTVSQWINAFVVVLLYTIDFLKEKVGFIFDIPNIHMGNLNCCTSSNNINGEADKETGEKISMINGGADKETGKKSNKDADNKGKIGTPFFLREKKAEASVPFPPEVTMEILSWLPLKPLIRFQLVCKEWRAQIQDRQFMEYQMHRTSFVHHWHNHTDVALEPDTDPFTYLHGCDGLLLMKNLRTQMHFLWNPAARLALQLPTPPNQNYGYALSFVPATKTYKIVYFFKDASFNHGCQILTPGSSSSREWRRLPFPDAVNVNSKLEASLVQAGGALHSVVLTKDGDAEIISLDVESEVVTVNCLLAGVFRHIKTARAIDCDGKLGFGVVVGQDLQLMVLEDYKRDIWSRDKKVIPLAFLKDGGFEGSNIVILLIREGEILFWLKGEKIFAYTMETGKMRDVEKVSGLSFCSKLYSYKPSMLTFEGMQPDDQLNNFRPRGL